MGSANAQADAAPGEILRQFYAALLKSFGPQGWWPARTRWEVICGAILTQNTTWTNAARAIKNLRQAGVLGRGRMLELPLQELETLIRPAGFYCQKARALHNIAQWIGQAHGGSLDALFAQPVELARAQLLALKGIGPETADAILLYSGGIRCLWPMLTRAGFSLATTSSPRRRITIPRGSSFINIWRRKNRCSMNFMRCWLKPRNDFATGVWQTVRNARWGNSWRSQALRAGN